MPSPRTIACSRVIHPKASEKRAHGLWFLKMFHGLWFHGMRQYRGWQVDHTRMTFPKIQNPGTREDNNNTIFGLNHPSDAIKKRNGVMTSTKRWKKRLDIGYIRRFIRKGAHEGVLYDDTNTESIQQARDRAALTVKRLNSCFIVGVVEQYPGFIEVLQRTLDPDSKDEENWQLAKKKIRNSSPVGSREVLEHVDPDLVIRFNTTVISLQWEVYSIALELWGSRCREVLPQEIHDVFCPVRR